MPKSDRVQDDETYILIRRPTPGGEDYRTTIQNDASGYYMGPFVMPTLVLALKAGMDHAGPCHPVVIR